MNSLNMEGWVETTTQKELTEGVRTFLKGQDLLQLDRIAKLVADLHSLMNEMNPNCGDSCDCDRSLCVRRIREALNEFSQ